MLLAQISDIHARADNDNLDRLGRAASWLETINPDLVICSGDLVDGGWVEGYASILAILGKLCCPTYYLPGNGDNRDAMRHVVGRRQDSDAQQRMHFSVAIGDIHVVGLDAAVDGEAFGDARPHLAWLQRNLTGHERGRPFLFSHHHMFRSGIKPMDDIGCVGVEDVAAVLTRSGPSPIAISSGHVHRSASGIVQGVPAFICGSICRPNPLLLDGRREPPISDVVSMMVFVIGANGTLAAHHVCL